jgi:hypothetical protein
MADGVILQFADQALILWCLGFVREGAREDDRDFAKPENSGGLGFRTI